MHNKNYIEDFLLKHCKIAERQMERILEIQRIQGKDISSILIEEDIIQEEVVLNILEEKTGIKRMDFSSIYIDKDAVKSIPYILGKKHCAVPLYFEEEERLIIAFNNPLDIIAIEDLELVSGKKIQPVMATKNEIENLLEKIFNNEDAEQVAEDFGNDYLAHNEEIDKNILNEVNHAPVVRLVNSIIEQGIRNNASDIHIEPFSDRVKVRMRVDGKLHDLMKVDKRIQNAIVSRIKILSDLNIAEKRLPQDGAFVTHIDNRDIDIRTSILPTIHGEKAVIRILDIGQFLMNKDQLGLTSLQLPLIEEMIHKPHGIVLVTGPTGSGKSSTLYTLLRELNKETDNIITVEDPVEFKIDGVNQVQVNLKSGLTFVKALRSILRQDPNILMIGEIRDVETAEIAVRASITGHLVFSTIHTNDAVSTITRLVDMGIPPYLVATSLSGVISQRLVRKICSKCKSSYAASTAEKKLLNIPYEEHIILYKGQGCGFCNKTGFKGRIAVYEVLKIAKEHREIISQSISTEKLRDLSIEKGMKTLSENAIILVKQGITTVEEVASIMFLEEA